MAENRYELNKNLAQMLKGGVMNRQESQKKQGLVQLWHLKEYRLTFVQQVAFQE